MLHLVRLTYHPEQLRPQPFVRIEQPETESVDRVEIFLLLTSPKTDIKKYPSIFTLVGHLNLIN